MATALPSKRSPPAREHRPSCSARARSASNSPRRSSSS
jgi:hypothetical protein